MNKKIVISIIIVLATLGGLIVWKLVQKTDTSPNKELLQEAPGLPEEQWVRVIQSHEREPGHKVLTNEYDGYEITVPAGWQTLETASVSGGLKAFYSTLSDPRVPEVNEGAMLNILSFDNQADLTISEWLKVSPGQDFIKHADIKVLQAPEGSVYKASGKIYEDRLKEEVAIEKSSKIIYLVKGKERIYLVMCWAVGNQYEELISVCEKEIIPTFKILE